MEICIMGFDIENNELLVTEQSLRIWENREPK